MDEATELLNKFYDPEQEAVKQIVKRTPMGMVTKFIGEEYWVEIPRLGLREHFDSIREAHEFLVNKKFQELLYLDRLSSERGYIFRIRNGQYSLVSEGGTFYAKDLEGALDILGRKADPSFAPNLFKGISEMDIEQFKAKKMTSYVADFWTTPNLTDITQPEMAGGAMSRQFTPMANWIETVARKYGFHKLAELYREADANYAIAMGQANKFRQVLIRELSEPEMGPMMNWGLSSKPKKLGLYPEEIRRGMLMWLEQVDDEGRNFVAKEMKLEERHIKSAKNIRELLGTSGVNGLAAKFGIPPERFLFGYLPRIRESAAKLGYGPGNPMKLDDSQLDQLILHAGVPSDLKFWAENERLSDLVNFAREGDLLRLLLTYSEQGHKKMFLNPVWKKIDDYVKNVPVGKIIRGAMDEYREMVMGTFTTRAEQRMKQFGRGVAARLGFKNPEVGTKLMDTIYTLTTLTTQAFRPFLTVRNMLQLYTTGHVLTDVRFVEKAMQEVAYDPLKAIQLGAELGYVKEAPPMLNEIQRGEGQGPAWLLGELTEKGMRGVQRSDALSRVVVYRAAGHQFDHAAKLFGKKAPMSLAAEEAFGLDLVARDVAAQAKALMGKGDAQSWNTARHLVSENLQRLTMFDYGKPNAPAAFHGLLGKAFGHLMVFPAYYAALVKHVFTHGSPARKIKTVAKLAGIATATYAGLELMGLDGKTFLPWVPMTMTGGPIVNLAIEALWSMDTTSYRGRQARGELQGMLTRTLVPGSYEYRMVSNFLKYMDEGKPWLAFLAISSAPIRTDLR
jgi:hypothetical protein